MQLHKVIITAIRASFSHSFIHVVNIRTCTYIYIYIYTCIYIYAINFHWGKLCKQQKRMEYGIRVFICMYILKMHQVISNSLSKVCSG